MDVDTFLAKNKSKYDVIQQLQDKLNHITEDTYGEIISFITNQKEFILNNHENTVLFLWNINTFTIYNFKKLEIILDIMIHFQDEIKEKVNEIEIIDIVKSLLCGLYYLYSKGFFTIETIVHNSINFPSIFAYFYPEINEYDPKLAEKQIKKIQREYHRNTNLIDFLDFVQNNIEKHKENRKNNSNPTHLHQIIREDNITEFQSILSKNNIDINYNFDYSFYERTLTENQTPSLIQIAATYGSLQIFKYLWMQNNINFDDNLICYAISGRNYEIIHLCEEKCSKKRALLFSINSHQHELTDYFIEFLENDDIEKVDGYEGDQNNFYDDLNIDLLLIAYQSANYHVILPCLKKIVYICDNIENNRNNTNYCTFLRKPIFDIDLFKFIYSHKNDNIDLFVGYYPIYLQWIFGGMTDAIKFVLLDLKPYQAYNFFASSLDMNMRISIVILDFLFENQNIEKIKSSLNYFKDKINFSFVLNCFKYFNEDLIEILLKVSEIEIDIKMFAEHLINDTSKKFIESLFKKNLNLLGPNKKLLEDELQKLILDED